MADLKKFGRILGLIGGLLMIIIGIIYAVNNLLGEVLISLDIFGVDFGMNIIGDVVSGEFQWLIVAAIKILCGIIAVYGYKQLGGKSKGDLLIWGIIYIILGLLGFGLGGLLIFLGGVILLIDNFL